MIRYALLVLIMFCCMCTMLFAQTPTFTDVTAASGIHFKHTDGRSGRFYFVEELGSGAAFLDYDNDADLDIYFVNGADLPGFQSNTPPTNALYRNEGDATFTDVTKSAGVGDAAYGVGVCGGDTDNDGYLDLSVTNFGSNILYSNNGDGTFADVTDRAGVGDGRWGASCAFADFDRDGDLDLYVTNYVQFALEKNKTCEIRGILTYCRPQDFSGSADVLYRNNGNDTGDDTFTDITTEAGVHKPRGRGLGVVWGDYDNDGYLDFYVANDTNENYLFHNNGDGTFSDTAYHGGVALSENGEMESGMGVDFGDYDNDEFLDIVVTNFQDQTATLYHNDGDGFFSDVSYVSRTGEKTLPSLGWGTCFFDYDNDGYKDLFIANGHVEYNVESFHPETTYEQTNHLFKNLTSGTFEEVTDHVGGDFSRKASSRGAAFGDYDDDGDIDILVTTSNDKPQLFRNDGGNRNNWIKVRVVGTASNRSGIGTRVRVVAGELAQIADVKSGSSYLSQNDLVVHFGLGRRTVIDRIVATLPNGNLLEMGAVGVNQLIDLEEPKKE